MVRFIVEIRINDVANIGNGVTRDAEFLECSKIVQPTIDSQSCVSSPLIQISGPTPRHHSDITTRVQK